MKVTIEKQADGALVARAGAVGTLRGCSTLDLARLREARATPALARALADGIGAVVVQVAAGVARPAAPPVARRGA